MIREITERSWKYFQTGKENPTFYFIGAHDGGCWEWYKGNKWSDKTYSLTTPKREECLVYKTKKTAISNFVNNPDYELKKLKCGKHITKLTKNLFHDYYIWKCVAKRPKPWFDDITFTVTKEEVIDIETERRGKLFNLVL